MKILFLEHYKWPHIGGVEKHVQQVTKYLKQKGHKVRIVSEEDIKYPHIKFLGLFYIWLWLFKNRSLIKQSDIIHIHDVFIWYLPFRFLYPKKKVFTTFHGWECIWPIPQKFILYKRLATKLSVGTIAVGKYIEKYYGIKADVIIYGGASHLGGAKAHPRGVHRIVFVGRLDADTGVVQFLEWLKNSSRQSLFKHFRGVIRQYKIDFVGDGPLRERCKKYGKVHGFCNPEPYLKRAEIVVPVGYLSYLEAKAAGCKIMTFANTPIKRDYWKGIKRLKKIPTWNDVANVYLKLWGLY